MRDRDRNEFGSRSAPGGPGAAALIGCLVLGLLGLAAVGGGAWFFLRDRGETHAEVTARYRPRFTDLRAKLKRIAANLPVAAGADSLPPNLDPKPVHDVPNGRFNATILMAEQCADPDRNLMSPNEFDLLFHEDEFYTHLKWTGDRSPLVESARSERNVGLAERMERSLAVRYLVIARPARFIPPRAVDDRTFGGGELDLDVFLVDLPAEKALGGFRRSFRPDPRVMVEFRQGARPGERAEAFVYSNVWSKARAEVLATLARGTGGTFAGEKGK